jgi:hypothetical protein
MFNLFFSKQNKNILEYYFVCQIEHIHTIKRACQYEISYLSIYIYIYRMRFFFFLYFCYLQIAL